MSSQEPEQEETASAVPSEQTEEVEQSGAEASTPPAAPALNREQRRAQAKGKKGTSPGFIANTSPGFRPGASRPANAPTQSRIPRTGHK